MPEEGKNTLYFQNNHKQTKTPFVIYADFEALVRKIQGCERGPDSMQKSYTEKTERHEACGYSYIVVRSDGEVFGSNLYKGKNAVGVFLSDRSAGRDSNKRESCHSKANSDDGRRLAKTQKRD